MNSFKLNANLLKDNLGGLMCLFLPLSLRKGKTLSFLCNSSLVSFYIFSSSTADI